MGILKKEVDGEQNLFLTHAQVQQIDGSGKAVMAPNFAGQANNDVGFFTSCTLGLAFSKANLQGMIQQYRNFRNSVMLVYDTEKSAYGLNPLKCYRLSEGAIKALQLDDATLLRNENALIQDKIRD